MTPLEIVNLSGVAARNATSALTDAAMVRSVLALESETRNRVIVTDAARKRLRALGATEAGSRAPEVVEAEPVALEAPTAVPGAVVPTEPDDSASATCPRCKEHKPVTMFGFRAMPSKAGPVIRRQSQCKKCRGMAAVKPRAAPVVVESAVCAPL